MQRRPWQAVILAPVKIYSDRNKSNVFYPVFSSVTVKRFGTMSLSSGCRFLDLRICGDAQQKYRLSAFKIEKMILHNDHTEWESTPILLSDLVRDHARAVTAAGRRRPAPAPSR